MIIARLRALFADAQRGDALGRPTPYAVAAAAVTFPGDAGHQAAWAGLTVLLVANPVLQAAVFGRVGSDAG